ncbi:anaerobic ribonucleoside triphosphate reductase [sediment metagenome]|uniref:Anaerobic ribonucleoside triphosphate reductase n=1 Tax=sediment metagenome TaxID=749907 RepID=D9PK72_9ZZZZ
MTNGEATKALVKKIAQNTKMPYFSITPTFSICPTHGYIKGEHFSCPQPNGGSQPCGKECEVFSRIVGYFRPVQNWNDGKQQEFKDRLEFLEDKAFTREFSWQKATA